MRSAPLSASNPTSVSQRPFTTITARPNPAGKRAGDVVFCVVALPVLAVGTLVMTLVMQIVSPGPVFFYQERIGYLGRRFRCYKFRTMSVDADSSIHRAHSQELIRTNVPWAKMDQKRDARLILGGRFIRASGLDELPQVINILRGEMSLIGPRPCLPYEYEQFAPWQRERFSALPGLTGLWQVSGKNRTTFDEMVRLDIRYAETKSWWLDLKIVVMTLPALLKQVWDTRNRQVAEVIPAPPPLAPLRAASESR